MSTTDDLPRVAEPLETQVSHPLLGVEDDDDDDGMLGEVGRQRSNSAPCGDPMLRDAAIAAQSDKKPKEGGSKKRNITVLCRFRPENAYEVANGGQTCVDYDGDGKSLTLNIEGRQPGTEKHRFMYHKVFPSYATQDDMFDYVGDNTVDSFVSGINCSVMAYGQTGTGKTYTMMGVLDKMGRVVDAQGLIPRVFNRLFATMSRQEDTTDFELTLNFVELYMEKINDLLRRDQDNKRVPVPPQFVNRLNQDEEKLEIREMGDGTLSVTNCTGARVHTMADAMNVIQSGLQRRATAATSQNVVSSRSHAIIIVTLKAHERYTKKHRNSQMYLVDLAGSEKVAKTETFGMRLDEAKMINKSLFCLGQVISALTEKRKRGQIPPHIPYRDSKLTRLLQNSLGGNALTYVVITCSPSSFNDQETLSSLRFGAKAQMITTVPVKNVHRTVEELEYLLLQAQDEINNQKATIGMLKNQLKSAKVAAQNQVPVAKHTDAASSSVTRFQNHIFESRLSNVISSCLQCPVTQRPMRDPVVCLDGYTYERRAIQQYFLNEENGLCSPITGQRVNATLLVPNLLMRSLFEMCKEEGLLLDPDRGMTITKAISCFEVVDVMGVIFDYINPQESLPYARVNATCARAIYDKERWMPLIYSQMETAPSQLVRQVQNLSLPAHKIFLILKEKVNYEEAQKALQNCVYSSSNLSLYSSGLARRPKPRK